MDALSKKAIKRKCQRTVEDELKEYVEMLDCCSLLELNERLGHGRKRLHDHLLGIAKKHIDNEHRYYDKNDKKIFGARCDVLVMKKRLMEIGFDYEAECAAVLEESIAYEKEKYGGVGIGHTKQNR